MPVHTLEPVERAPPPRLAPSRPTDVTSADATDKPLFRAKAMAAQQERLYGRPVALLPMSWLVTTALITLLIIVAIVFLTTQSFARKETVRGVLRADGGELRVGASRSGTIQALAVAEGDLVAEGDVLAVVSTAQRTEDGLNADEATLASLDREEQQLLVRLAAFDAAQPFEAAANDAAMRRLAAERQTTLDTIATSRARLTLSRARLEAGESLQEKGFIPGDELFRRREAVIALEQAIAEAQGKIGSIEASVAETDARRAKQPLDAAQARAQVVQSLDALAQRRAQAQAAKGYVVRAPRAGQVTALQVNLGQQVDPNRPLMTLTAPAAVLSAALFVPSRAIGFVAPGQSVRLLYDAFPYQRFGTASGRIETISATTLAPAEIQAGVKTEEPVYRVLVTLDEQAMNAFGRRVALQPGMELTADLILETRSLAAWLLEPVLALRGRQ